ncbi:MAG: hypothetical protein JWM80_970, partial [Cyanobacteria bacterium RYN_339]|nr:hypothetical protein [Cyanobacteria bacterium RYN_339]
RALVDGRSGLLGKFNPASYKRAVELVYGHLRQEPTYNPNGGLERFNSWLQADPELKRLYDELRGALGTSTGNYADLVTTLERLNGQVSPSRPPMSAAPSAKPTPSAGPAALPTATPTPVVPQAGVHTLVGLNGSGYVDGPVATAKLAGIEAIAVDPAGNLWVGETGNHRIRMITPEGTVSTVAGTGARGYVDGPGDQAQFGRLAGFYMDGLGTLYIADMANKRIRKIDTLDATHTVTTVASDLENPACITQDEISSTLYVTEFSGLDVRKVELNGTSKKLATGFSEPWGIAMLNAVLYVVDADAGAVKKVELDGKVSSFAGGFLRPHGLASDGKGYLYVADQGHHRVQRIGADGGVDTIAGTGAAGDADGAPETATLRSPTAVAVGPDGAVYVVDGIVDRIRVIR